MLLLHTVYVMINRRWNEIRWIKHCFSSYRIPQSTKGTLMNSIIFCIKFNLIPHRIPINNDYCLQLYLLHFLPSRPSSHTTVIDNPCSPTILLEAEAWVLSPLSSLSRGYIHTALDCLQWDHTPRMVISYNFMIIIQSVSEYQKYIRGGGVGGGGVWDVRASRD